MSTKYHEMTVKMRASVDTLLISDGETNVDGPNVAFVENEIEFEEIASPSLSSVHRSDGAEKTLAAQSPPPQEATLGSPATAANHPRKQTNQDEGRKKKIHATGLSTPVARAKETPSQIDGPTERLVATAAPQERTWPPFEEALYRECVVELCDPRKNHLAVTPYRLAKLVGTTEDMAINILDRMEANGLVEAFGRRKARNVVKNEHSLRAFESSLPNDTSCRDFSNILGKEFADPKRLDAPTDSEPIASMGTISSLDPMVMRNRSHENLRKRVLDDDDDSTASEGEDDIRREKLKAPVLPPLPASNEKGKRLRRPLFQGPEADIPRSAGEVVLQHPVSNRNAFELLAISQTPIIEDEKSLISSTPVKQPAAVPQAPPTKRMKLSIVRTPVSQSA
eukprot:ANDGO_03064.mRNA.1 hypothetical protein